MTLCFLSLAGGPLSAKGVSDGVGAGIKQGVRGGKIGGKNQCDLLDMGEGREERPQKIL